MVASIAVYVIADIVITAIALTNVVRAYKLLKFEDSKFNRCSKKMKFLAVTMPMMCLMAFMIIKTAFLHIAMTGSNHITLHDWLWVIVDLNQVLWVYYGLELVGACK